LEGKGKLWERKRAGLREVKREGKGQVIGEEGQVMGEEKGRLKGGEERG
jgi:hypothetical protein